MTLKPEKDKVKQTKLSLKGNDSTLQKKMISSDGTLREFKSFKLDVWRTYDEADWAAKFMRENPEIKASGEGGTWGIKTETIVKRDKGVYRVWFRETKIPKKKFAQRITESRFKGKIYLKMGNKTMILSENFDTHLEAERFATKIQKQPRFKGKNVRVLNTKTYGPEVWTEIPEHWRNE